MLWFWVRPECVEANLDQRLLVALVRWVREAFANLRVRFRVSATDERQLALLGDAGLQEVDRRVLQRVETVFFA